jgi:hypothetical protein
MRILYIRLVFPTTISVAPMDRPRFTSALASESESCEMWSSRMSDAEVTINEPAGPERKRTHLPHLPYLRLNAVISWHLVTMVVHGQLHMLLLRRSFSPHPILTKQLP